MNGPQIIYLHLKKIADRNDRGIEKYKVVLGGLEQKEDDKK